MKRGIQWLTAASLVLCGIFTGLHFAGFDWALSLAITFGTFLYHFAMRLLVGCSVDRIKRNKADYTRAWYQLRSFEIGLYRFLKVKKWKGKMPTYDPTLFDPKLHSWDEIAQAMCQAELVHEIIIVLSFLPLTAAIPFGSFGVFLITSILAACFDLCFVIMQRFNRPRVLRCVRLAKKSSANRRNTDVQMESQIN